MPAFSSRSFRLFSLLAGLLTAPLFPACGGGDDDSSDSAPSQKGKIGATSFLLVSSSGLTFSGSTLAGSGSAIAKDPLGDLKDDKNIAVTFTVQDGGSVSLRAFADKALAGGVALNVSRKGKVLAATLQAGGKSVDVSRAFGVFDASGEVSLLLDVHNGETPAHVLAWKGGTATPSDTNAVFNSEKAGDGESPGNGKGTFWGFVLDKATVKSAAVSEAKFEHD